MLYVHVGNNKKTTGPRRYARIILFMYNNNINNETGRQVSLNKSVVVVRCVCVCALCTREKRAHAFHTARQLAGNGRGASCSLAAPGKDLVVSKHARTQKQYRRIGLRAARLTVVRAGVCVCQMAFEFF